MRPRRGYGIIIAREHATCNRGGKSDRLNILERTVTAWPAGGRATGTCAGCRVGAGGEKGGRVLCSLPCAVWCCGAEAPGVSTVGLHLQITMAVLRARAWRGGGSVRMSLAGQTLCACMHVTRIDARLAPAGRCGVASLGPSTYLAGTRTPVRLNSTQPAGTQTRRLIHVTLERE
jgi:hypothetical protein